MNNRVAIALASVLVIGVGIVIGIVLYFGTGQGVILGVSVSVSPISISPTPQNVWNGKMLNYGVTINNNRNVTDTYSLIITDNAGWIQRITWPLTVPAHSAQNHGFGFGIAIPPGTIGDTVDIITFTVTSQTDNTVSASCTYTVISIAENKSEDERQVGDWVLNVRVTPQKTTIGGTATVEGTIKYVGSDNFTVLGDPAFIGISEITNENDFRTKWIPPQMPTTFDILREIRIYPQFSQSIQENIIFNENYFHSCTPGIYVIELQALGPNPDKSLANITTELFVEVKP